MVYEFPMRKVDVTWCLIFMICHRDVLEWKEEHVRCVIRSLPMPTWCFYHGKQY